jgi:hypothetical protein
VVAAVVRDRRAVGFGVIIATLELRKWRRRVIRDRVPGVPSVAMLEAEADRRPAYEAAASRPGTGTR